MGEARLRGTFEERRATAIKKNTLANRIKRRLNKQHKNMNLMFNKFKHRKRNYLRLIGLVSIVFVAVGCSDIIVDELTTKDGKLIRSFIETCEARPDHFYTISKKVTGSYWEVKCHIRLETPE
jgi:hypothetical protein